MENLITIKLFGQTYTFKTESDLGKAQAIADSLVKEVGRIQEQGPSQSSEMAKLTLLISAALNFANENYELRVNYSKLASHLADRSKRLLQNIDNGLQFKV